MTVFYLLTFLVCGAYVLLMISYFIGWNKTNEWAVKPPTPNSQLPTKVSVIIPVRNEEQNILKLLDCLYKQSYPLSNFEIIVVDDHSTDRTAEFIYALDIPNLKLVQLNENQQGKKSAISEGIKTAAGNLIITTDADCEMGENWLSVIVSFYEEKKPKMIVAPVLLSQEHGVRSMEKSSQLPTFFQIIQSQEMTVLTASACASLHYNLPILCSGANLCYEKDAFMSVNGFEGVDKTATGDDVFLMRKIHKKFPCEINYLKSKDAVVFTPPEKSSSDALSQRKRWASKSFSYGFSYITLIAVFVFITNFLILISGILSVINIKFALALVATLPLKCIVDFMLLQSASCFFGKRIHPFIFILASMVYPVYVSLIGFISPFTNYSWKGRKGSNR